MRTPLYHSPGGVGRRRDARCGLGGRRGVCSPGPPAHARCEGQQPWFTAATAQGGLGQVCSAFPSLQGRVARHAVRLWRTHGAEESAQFCGDVGHTERLLDRVPPDAPTPRGRSSGRAAGQKARCDRRPRLPGPLARPARHVPRLRPHPRAVEGHCAASSCAMGSRLRCARRHGLCCRRLLTRDRHTSRGAVHGDAAQLRDV
mmetsp:Transcript_86764/g.271527  ORF Transcript_86764/g.271527 Transcript_86764/m.271527 type:complete len:202 (+) Transcript_86764:6-611(+)